MTRRLRIREVRRKEIDEDKLALAFLLLAKQLQEETNAKPSDTDSGPTAERPEAA